MKRLVLLLMLLITCLCLGGPIGILRGYYSTRLEELFMATIANPQWNELALNCETASAGNYKRFSALVYLHGASERPLFSSMSQPDMAALEKFVRDGGTLMILADGLRQGIGKSGVIFQMLGAEKTVPFSGNATPATGLWQECCRESALFDYARRNRHSALSGLNGAKALVGIGNKALAAVNSYGKGKVYFINIRLTENWNLAGGKPVRNGIYLEQYLPFARNIHAALVASGVTVRRVPGKTWDTKPLGAYAEPDVADHKVKEFKSKRQYVKLKGPGLKIAANGVAHAIIAYDNFANSSGARNIAFAIREMTGVNIPVAMSKHLRSVNKQWRYGKKIFRTKIEVRTGRKIEIFTAGNAIIIKTPDDTVGAACFMYEILGYRMLWPQRSGKYYPVRRDLEVQPFRYSDEPFFSTRIIRGVESNDYNRYMAVKKNGGNSPDAQRFKLMEKAGFQLGEILRRRQENGREWMMFHRLKYRHIRSEMTTVAISRMKSLDISVNRRRAALPFIADSGTFGLCLSNPEVISMVADSVIRGGSRANIVFNDVLCMCQRCRHWDPENGDMLFCRSSAGKFRTWFKYTAPSNRELRFLKEVETLVSKRYSNLMFCYTGYGNRDVAPVNFKSAPKNLALTFTFSNMQNPAQSDEMQEKLIRWQSGCSEISIYVPPFSTRPRPVTYVGEIARNLRRFAETGVKNVTFDVVTGNWATDGLNYFAAAQLMWDPFRSAEEIIEEYCRGFGNAAPEMKKYFMYCEQFSAEGRADDALKEDNLNTLAGFLESAKSAVSGDRNALKKVEIVASGLEFCRWEARLETEAKTKRRNPNWVSAGLRFCREFAKKYPLSINMMHTFNRLYYSYWR